MSLNISELLLTLCVTLNGRLHSTKKINIAGTGQNCLAQTHSLCRERLKYTLQTIQDLAGLSMMFKFTCQYGCLANCSL